MNEENNIFNGFDNELFDFLADLEKNNNTEWFHENKPRYQEYLVKPAKQYITEVAPFLNRLNPAIRTEPKFNKTIMRLNKDMRFTKGAPYKNYFLIHFGRFKMDSEFFLYFAPGQTDIGIFLNRSKGGELHFRNNFDRYKKEINKVFSENGLNNKFSFHEIKKEPELILKKFDADKHLDMFDHYEHILLQKNNFTVKHVLTDNLLPFSVKLFTDLYPLLCFAYFPDPLKEIENYRETIGKIIS